MFSAAARICSQFVYAPLPSGMMAGYGRAGLNFPDSEGKFLVGHPNCVRRFSVIGTVPSEPTMQPRC